MLMWIFTSFSQQFSIINNIIWNFLNNIFLNQIWNIQFLFIDISLKGANRKRNWVNFKCIYSNEGIFPHEGISFLLKNKFILRFHFQHGLILSNRSLSSFFLKFPLQNLLFTPSIIPNIIPYSFPIISHLLFLLKENNIPNHEFLSHYIQVLLQQIN